MYYITPYVEGTSLWVAGDFLFDVDQATATDDVDDVFFIDRCPLYRSNRYFMLLNVCVCVFI